MTTPVFSLEPDSRDMLLSHQRVLPLTLLVLDIFLSALSSE